MKIISPLPHKRGRIEIIPLIDIMFFLLAAFMVVSINKIKVDSLKINLPTDVPSTTHETKEDFISISIDEHGQVAIEKDLMTSKDALVARLNQLYTGNHDQKILISADRETRHGDVMTALGIIRQAGFQRVAFSIKKEPITGVNDEGIPISAPPTPATPAAATSTPAAPVPATSSAPPASTPAPASSSPSPNAPPAPSSSSSASPGAK